ncbi:MAG: hypothetical protein ACPG8W_24195, partial [Candidatus Promineifilaceae bacterium]
MSQNLFPNYMQLREESRIPVSAWNVIRVGSFIFTLGLIVLLIVRPHIGLPILWRLLIPTLPLIFLVAPGLWRNVCPLATANQTPRLFNFTRALTTPAWFAEYSYVIGFALFFVLASSRKILFNNSGLAS